MRPVTHKLTHSLLATSISVVLLGAIRPVLAQTPFPPSTTAPVPTNSSASVTPPPGLTTPLQGGNGPATPGVGSGTSVTPASGPVVVPEDYRLDTGDTVQVDVLRHGEVSRSVRLLSDARLRLPRLNGPIQARGKTCAELADEISEKLVKEGKLRLVPNAVSVSVTDMRMRRLYVRGNAGRSGDFDLKNGWRVSEIIAVMGGVTNPERVTTRILNPARPAPLSLNLANALANPDSADNVYLQEGDTITLDIPRQKRFTVEGEGPRGQHEIDERIGLRQALVQLGFSTNGATGDLRKCRLYRHEVPSDPTSPATPIPVDLLALLSKDDTPDIPLQDNDTLQIPVSMNFISIWGETSAPRKWLLPQDRPTYLADVMALGGTSGRAKIDSIQIYRPGEFVDKEGHPKPKTFKFGKFLSKGDTTQNPEIKPGDMVYVPAVSRPDVIGGIWQSWGVFGIIQAVVPGARLR